jgi:DNA-binding NarL/FixJ family response regulator
MAVVMGRVLLIEDDGRVARSWRRLLRSEGWDVDGASTLASARRTLDRTDDYDVVLLDLSLPDGRGLVLIPELNERRPSPKIVVITGEANADLHVDLVDKVDAVIPKPIAPETVRTLMNKMARSADGEPRLADFAAQHRLSPNETRVLELAANGASRAEIADTLGCKTSAISTYWKRIAAKTGCRGQREVIAKLWRHSQSLR